jgi:putative peptidoglycan lipid II flippase
MAQAAGILSLGNVTSRITGLVRVIVKSNLFGAGPDVSSLDAAVRLPTTIYDLLVGGMISSALVPVLSEYTSPNRREELWRLLSVLISIASLVVCALLVLGELLAPQVVFLMAGGMSPQARSTATELLRVVLPAILFLNLSGIIMGALYSLKRFAFPAFTASIFNAAVVVGALVLGRRFGVHSMAIGLVVGSILQVVVQLPGLRDARFRLALRLRHPALRRIGRLYLPILIGLAVDNLLSVVLSYNLASHLGDSAISWMEFAAQIIQFPLGLVAVAISVATLPTLSQQANASQTVAFKTTLAQGMRLVLALIFPAAVGLFVAATPLVALVFGHGEFTSLDTMAVAQALRYHLPGLIFAAVDQLLIFAFYARRDTMTPALVGVWTTVLYAVAAFLLFRLGVLTLPLLILINSFKWAAHAIAMLLLTRRRLGRWGDHGLWNLTLKAIFASLMMAVAAWGAIRLTTAIAPANLAGELLIVGGSGLVGLTVYTLLALALRMEELQLVGAVLANARRGLLRLLQRTPPPPQALAEGQPVPRIEPGDESGPQPVSPERYDQEYFLSACEGYEEFIASEGAELSRRLSTAFGATSIEPGMRILDVGCGRGEILRRCAQLGARAYGIDYAPAAVAMSQQALSDERLAAVYRADAKLLPFVDALFDRVLLFDIVEHLHPWELDQALQEVHRVLRPDGKVIVHTAPNAWYDRYAYPVVRLVRTLMGQGARYAKDPRAIIPANLDVHVNEQSARSLRRVLRRNRFRGRVWLDTPPQNRQEGWLFRVARHILFNWPPFRWFFEREVLAVAEKADGPTSTASPKSGRSGRLGFAGSDNDQV